MKKNLVEGWKGSKYLLDSCLISVRRDNKDKRVIENPEIAWDILLENYSKNPKVIKVVIHEIKNEKYPFVSLHKYNVWNTIADIYKKNKEVITVVEEWISKQNEHNDMEVAGAVMINKSNKMKQMLLERVKTSTYPQWLIGTLLKIWDDDSQVINLSASKQYVNDNPATEITIYKI